MGRDDRNVCTYFKIETDVDQNLVNDFFLILTVWGPVEKIWGYWLNFWKNKFCKQNLTKEREQPPVIILQQAIFYNVFILFLWLRIIWSFNEDVYFMSFSSQIFFNNIIHGYRAAIWKKNSLWLLPFFVAVATHWEATMMKRCAEWCALQLYRTF